MAKSSCKSMNSCKSKGLLGKGKKGNRAHGPKKGARTKFESNAKKKPGKQY